MRCLRQVLVRPHVAGLCWKQLGRHFDCDCGVRRTACIEVGQSLAVIYTADIQDRDGAPLVLEEIVKISPVAALYLCRWWRSLSRAPALAGSRRAGNKVNDALGRTAQWTIEIISRSDPTRVFEAALTLAWLHRSRRLAKKFKQTIASATAWFFVASIQLFTSCIAKL